MTQDPRRNQTFDWSDELDKAVESSPAVRGFTDASQSFERVDTPANPPSRRPALCT